MACIYTNLSVPTRTDDVFNFSLKWWWDQMPAVGFTDSIGTSWGLMTPIIQYYLTDTSLIQQIVD